MSAQNATNSTWWRGSTGATGFKTSTDPCFYPEAVNLGMEEAEKESEEERGG